MVASGTCRQWGGTQSECWCDRERLNTLRQAVLVGGRLRDGKIEVQQHARPRDRDRGWQVDRYSRGGRAGRSTSIGERTSGKSSCGGEGDTSESRIVDADRGRRINTLRNAGRRERFSLSVGMDKLDALFSSSRNGIESDALPRLAPESNPGNSYVKFGQLAVRCARHNNCNVGISLKLGSLLYVSGCAAARKCQG